METKANYVLIGAFTLAVVAAAFGFVFWFQNLGAAAQRVPLRIVFEARRPACALAATSTSTASRSAKSLRSSSTIPSASSSSPTSTRARRSARTRSLVWNSPV
jgi:hypothetical protein